MGSPCPERLRRFFGEHPLPHLPGLGESQGSGTGQSSRNHCPQVPGVGAIGTSQGLYHKGQREPGSAVSLCGWDVAADLRSRPLLLSLSSRSAPNGSSHSPRQRRRETPGSARVPVLVGIRWCPTCTPHPSCKKHEPGVCRWGPQSSQTVEISGGDGREPGEPALMASLV
jgi:hypothetical protein